MEHLAGAVRVAAQDEAWPEPPKQLPRPGDSNRRSVRGQSPLGAQGQATPYIMKLNIKPLLGWGLLFFP